MRSVRRRCIERTPMPKLVCTILFRQFLEDAPRPGRPFEADVDKMKSLIDASRRTTTPEIAERLNLSNAIFHKHMKRLGLISKLDIWVPHVLTERNLLRRINVCDTQRNDPFLNRIITVKEKFVVYNNVTRTV